jgi:hypothetical protein
MTPTSPTLATPPPAIPQAQPQQPVPPPAETTTDIFEVLENRITSWIEAWLTPSRRAIIGGFIAHIVEMGAKSEDTIIALAVSRLVDTYKHTSRKFAYAVVAHVHAELVKTDHPLLTEFDQQLQHAMDVTSSPFSFDSRLTAPPLT